MNIYIIEDDEIMQDCLVEALRPLLSTEDGGVVSAPHTDGTGNSSCSPGAPQLHCFTNALEAMSAIDAAPPQLIYLDVLLDGPDAFTLLHELASYSDLSRIPVVLVTSLSLQARSLRDYGVVGILDKATMTPLDIRSYAYDYCTR